MINICLHILNNYGSRLSATRREHRERELFTETAQKNTFPFYNILFINIDNAEVIFFMVISCFTSFFLSFSILLSRPLTDFIHIHVSFFHAVSVTISSLVVCELSF